MDIKIDVASRACYENLLVGYYVALRNTVHLVRFGVLRLDQYKDRSTLIYEPA